MPKPSDEVLALMAAQGDKDAFGALVERYKDMVYTVAWRMQRMRRRIPS